MKEIVEIISSFDNILYKKVFYRNLLKAQVKKDEKFFYLRAIKLHFPKYKKNHFSETIGHFPGKRFSGTLYD